MNRADLIGGVGITAAGLLLIFYVIPVWTAEGMFFGLPPTFFPTVMAAGLTASGVGLLLQAWRQRMSRAKSGPAPITGWNLLMFLIAAAISLAGVIAIDYFGIVYAGPVVIAGFMLFMGERNVLRIAATAAIPVAAVYLMARYVLYAPLP